MLREVKGMSERKRRLFEEERVLLMFEEKARRYEKYLTKLRADIAADSAKTAPVVPLP